MDIDRLLVLCAVRVEGKSLDWSMLARYARAGLLDDLYEGHLPSAESVTNRGQQTALLRAGLADLTEARDRVSRELEAAEKAHAWCTTVLDDTYPANLREVHDLPPFLFGRGELREHDIKAVAVVGTRQASQEGLRRAARMAAELTEVGVTVVSGLARGIDTAAHTSAIEHDGRTIAVLGTGITKCYPAENAALADRITHHGAVVSQFWPTRTPGRDTFPRRNRVTSGISQGTVVIEASRTSGAKLQARLAHEHGKRVWLIHSLVTAQDWAQRMVRDHAAIEVRSTDEVVSDLRSPVTRQVQTEEQPALTFA